MRYEYRSYILVVFGYSNHYIINNMQLMAKQKELDKYMIWLRRKHKLQKLADTCHSSKTLREVIQYYNGLTFGIIGSHNTYKKEDTKVIAPVKPRTI